VILVVFRKNLPKENTPMALCESALSELVVALTDRDRGVDLVRELAQWLAQELIGVQATQVIGAALDERSDGRVTERNGHRHRVLTTKADDLELAIPKLRKGSFFPSILEARRRIDQALYAVVMEADVSGVSTRSVDALVESMGAASGISKSEVSRICAVCDDALG
jgi:putative transposase